MVLFELARERREVCVTLSLSLCLCLSLSLSLSLPHLLSLEVG